MCILNKETTSIFVVNMKRLYFSIWILITSIIINHLPEDDIVEFGKNNFGFSEKIWLIILLFISGTIIYFVIISDKDLVIKDNKLQSQKFEKKIARSINENNETIKDLQSKIDYYYNIYMRISDFVNISLSNDTFNYIQSILLILEAYYQYNEKINVIVTTTDGIIEFNIDRQELANSITTDTVLNYRRDDVNYLIIPFVSTIYELDIIYIILSSNDVFFENEYKLIVTLLNKYEITMINTI